VTEPERERLLEALSRNGLPTDTAGSQLTHTEIIEYVYRLQLDYRARYNLACYYAGIGDGDTEVDAQRSSYERAFSELSAALRNAPADLVRWSQHDPSLDGFRADPESGIKLRKLARTLAAESSKA
jgi:hypothetical protein